MREAAKILKGRQVKARTLVIPSTQEVFKQCAAEGLIQIFVESGCTLFPAYCGTCQTLSIGHLAPGRDTDAPRSEELGGKDGGGFVDLSGLAGDVRGHGGGGKGRRSQKLS